jgi:parvulin-like peptidyl-prolyl isomerase
MTMNKILKEPLVHFLIAGIALFAVYDWINDGTEEDTPKVVRITAEEVQWLQETWSRQYQRPPEEQELRGILSDYLKEKLLAKEAEELGLAENDTVVRRRLAQKMEFIIRDTVRAVEPNEEKLRELYENNQERFQNPARISFVHVFFKAEDPKAVDRATQTLGELRQFTPSADVHEFGDHTLLESEYILEEQPSVKNIFGSDFANDLFQQQPGEWQGPIQSSYGLHLVLISEKEPGTQQPFDDVRDRVAELWHQQNEELQNQKYFASLMKKYDLVADESVKPLLAQTEVPAEIAK